MDTDILKSYPELEGVKPYDDDEPRPDEVHSEEELKRALATMIVHAEEKKHREKRKGDTQRAL